MIIEWLLGTQVAHPCARQDKGVYFLVDSVRFFHKYNWCDFCCYLWVLCWHHVVILAQQLKLSCVLSKLCVSPSHQWSHIHMWSVSTLKHSLSPFPAPPPQSWRVLNHLGVYWGAGSAAEHSPYERDESPCPSWRDFLPTGIGSH